jgi:hypothetical protein
MGAAKTASWDLVNIEKIFRSKRLIPYCSSWYLLYGVEKMNANVCILIMYPRESGVL